MPFMPKYLNFGIVRNTYSLHKKWSLQSRVSSVNVTFTEEILDRKLHFLCSDSCYYLMSNLNAVPKVLIKTYLLTGSSTKLCYYVMTRLLILTRTPFLAFSEGQHYNATFLFPLETPKNRKVFRNFQGVEKGCISNDWVKYFIDTFESCF